MNIVVYFSPHLDPPRQIRDWLTKNQIQVQKIASAPTANAEMRILVVDRQLLEKERAGWIRQAAAVLVVLKNDEESSLAKLPEDIPSDTCVGEIDLHSLTSLVHTVVVEQQVREVRRERDAYLTRLKELNKIGIALSTERDPVRLFNMILQKSREITSADAGSLYLVEQESESKKRLRFKISQNDSMPLNYEEYVMPITSNSIAGFVAITGEVLNIPDVYRISAECEYDFNRDYDDRTGYRTSSMLTVPMQNHIGETIGIIQLINRKKSFADRLTSDKYAELVVPFDANDADLVGSLASQAAVALENNILIKEIEQLFEGFVKASVTAIESRDPTTSGHSFRVADLTVSLAQTVDALADGKFKEINFTSNEIKEMRYAALLHDFGKVGVRENVLVKAKKLYPMQLDLIRQRFAYFRKSWEAELYKSKLDLLLSQGREIYDGKLLEIEAIYGNRLNSLDDYLAFIISSNEPTLLAEGNFERLLKMTGEEELVPPGIEGPLMMPEELQLLSIRKGSLNDRERLEIESHVTHTFSFLSKIPWTSELKEVPRIAYGHHEKLNGSGYPNRLKASDISIQTRMMTISDIYDALTASDRPYKRAVPSEKALDIIANEVQAQQVDPDLFRIFIDAKIYRVTTQK
jgi:HD-GYP domain-containing protein (c-di-GMP phosphodiesterase class II)